MTTCHITADNDHPCLRCGAPFTSLEKMYGRVQQRTPIPHLYDHEGTWRHHHHDQTGEPVWWLNVTVYGGEKRPHRHDVPLYWDHEWASLGNIECRCGDVFPTVESFHEHIHLSHPDADHPFAPFDDLETENTRLRQAIEDFILWWDMPPFALDDDERLRVEVDALRAALDPSKVTSK